MIDLDDYIKKYNRKPIKLITGEYSLLDEGFIFILFLILIIITLILK
jgi:hypothetical protein